MKTAVLLVLICLLGFALRVYHLTANPPSTYLDEAAIGYNAYSIVQTGKDEWAIPYPVLFRSFDDYKLPVYIYTVALLENYFGPTDFAIRLPAVISGTLTILFIFLLVRELTYLSNIKIISRSRNKLSLLTGLILAIAPWHLHFTRAGFEAGMSLMFVVCGTWLFALSIRRNIWLLLPSLIFYSLATLTYHNAKVFLPLFVTTLFIIYFKEIRVKWKAIFIILALALIINIPTASTWFTSEGRARLTSQSILRQPGDLLTNIQINYATNFSFDYLFFHGDQNGRHSVKKMGELFLWQLPIILTAIYFLLRKRSKFATIIFTWLIISPIPAAITNVSPHALRGLLMVIPLSILTAVGLIAINKKYSRLSLLICPVVIYALFFYSHLYYFFYPKYYATDWQDGYRSAAKYIDMVKNKYDQIFFDGEIAPIYLLFYTKFPPEKLHQSGHDMKNFGKLKYSKEVSSIVVKGPSKKMLYVVSWRKSLPGWKLVKKINMINGDFMFKIYEF